MFIHDRDTSNYLIMFNAIRDLITIRIILLISCTYLLCQLNGATPMTIRLKLNIIISYSYIELRKILYCYVLYIRICYFINVKQQRCSIVISKVNKKNRMVYKYISISLSDHFRFKYNAHCYKRCYKMR